MSIESEPRQGTKVTLIVPLEKPLPVSDSPTANEPEFPHASTVDARHHEDAPQSLSTQPSTTTMVRVLLVDDHTLLRQGLRSVLDEYDDIDIVGEAADGEQAVTLAKSLHPDIVIMDVNMPCIDGIEATRQLKRERPDILVIGLSVDNSKQVEEVMRGAGAVSFLTKDAAIEQLHEIILQVLQAPA